MSARITPQTIVKTAVECCPAAASIFESHGVDVLCSCKGMYANITLAEAEEWCNIKDLNGLIKELNNAIS